MSKNLVWKLLVTVALGLALSGCGVQRMQMDEQEVKTEWGSVLSRVSEQIDVVQKAWPKKAGDTSATALEEAQAALKKGMDRWSEIPSRADLEAGGRAIALASKAVREKVAAERQAGAAGVDAVEARLDELAKQAQAASARYTIAARTYNDIINLYPSKWLAKALMKDQAVTFDEVESLSGQVTEAGMLEKLGVAR